MVVTFPFDKATSPIFGTVYRPIAWIDFWSTTKNDWIGIWMIIDSGADYSLLPSYMSSYLGVNLKHDCRTFSTTGIGGKEKVYLLEKAKIRLGGWEIGAPVGFLENNDIPPLLGRQGFMEKFATLFFDHKTYFSDKKPRF